MTVTAAASASTPLAITLFGPMQVWVHDRPLPHMRSRKALWLLALLALRHGRPVQREWLAATLWPDTHQSQASTYLSVVLSELRRALGNQRERLQSPSRHALSLDPAGADIDVITFDTALASNKPEALKQAVALYRGPLLEDCAEEWVHQERNARTLDCLQSLQTLGDVALAAGDYPGAVEYFRRAVELDAWREVARRGWMEALAKSGNRNAALQVYREFAELLRSDPSAVPDEETSALYARLRAEGRPRTSLPSAVSGEESVANEAAPPVVSGYLPHPLTDLVGREQERIDIIARLRGSRLVTLTGLGGIGKTRLALDVASESVQDMAVYPDGVWLVALESLSEGRLVVTQVASVLRLREEPERSLLESLTEHLRTKRLLLVLDNCEHLLEASAQVIAHLLRECARVRVLATSREALGITGENAWQVSALPWPDPAHLPLEMATLLKVLTGYESVQLFVERAQAVQKGFALTMSNAMGVAQACSQLEGIPLAIELAAARVKAMTVEQIAARLNDHLSLLTGGNRVAQSRQQTLRATLDWSYTLLLEAERVLLARLSVFAGGWTLEAAVQVCTRESIAAGQILDLLSSLVDKSLVVFLDPSREAGGRYRLLEIMRQYAAERLQASGEVDAIRKQHGDWLVILAEEADSQLNSTEQEHWLHRLEIEHDNLRAALSWSAKAEEGVETELRLVGALWRFWDIHGHYREGRRYLERALERLETQEETAARAKALTGAAALSLRQGDLAAARKLHQQSLSIFRKLGNKRAIAGSLANQGTVAWTQGDYDEARKLLEESLNINRELDNKVGILSALHGLGQLVQWQGDYATASTLFEESLSLAKQIGDQRSIAFLLDSFGNLRMLLGEYAAAWTWFEESLNLRRELGDKYGVALSTGSLGLVAKIQGDSVLAQRLLEEALTIFNELGDKQGIALSLGNQGILMSEQGNFAQAQALLEEGLALLRQIGDRDGIAFSLCNLGNAVKMRGDYASARALLQESLTVRYAMGNKLGVAESLEGIAVVMLAQMETAQAVALWGIAQALRDTIGVPLPLNERTNYKERLGQARAILGENTFATAWEKGCTLPWEQIALLVA